MTQEPSNKRIKIMEGQDSSARCKSPDIFEDCSPILESNSCPDVVLQIEDDEEFYTEGVDEVGRGCSLDELRNGFGPWEVQQYPSIVSSNSHSVLFKVKGQNYVPSTTEVTDSWDGNHVRLPSSTQSLYPVKDDTGSSLKSRWDLINIALLNSIVSSHQLEAAILSYNSRYSDRWDFSVLHHLFSETLDEEEVSYFFENIFPSMVQLALQLPSLITSPIPLLKKHTNHSISLSQLQIASLLANAFFCTFPRRNTAKRKSEYSTYPEINFIGLFHKNHKIIGRNVEKLKCLLNYFKRVCTKAPDGVVTYTRQHISKQNFPHWETSKTTLCKLHIKNTGTIEDEGKGMLQVDFANKFIGGGVLRTGCVQEEIRFVICPELIASCLFTEELEPTEAVIISGCERFSDYTGYGDSFEWSGDHKDVTPRDSSGRRMCFVVAIDALCFHYPKAQFKPENIRRELNKAYAGFYPGKDKPIQLCPVATGNWGCGVFQGDKSLKLLIQLMAASEAGRNMVYFTFGDNELVEEGYNIYTFLVDNKVTVGQLWRFLCRFYEYKLGSNGKNRDLYSFLYQIASNYPESNSNFSLKNESFQPAFQISSKSASVNTFPNSSTCSSKITKSNTLDESEIGAFLHSLEDPFSAQADAFKLKGSETSTKSEVGKSSDNFACSISDRKKPYNEERSSSGSESSNCVNNLCIKESRSLIDSLEKCDKEASKFISKTKISDYFFVQPKRKE